MYNATNQQIKVFVKHRCIRPLFELLHDNGEQTRTQLQLCSNIIMILTVFK